MSYRPKPGAKERRAPGTDARGNQRVYIDIPGDLVRKLNVLAAMRSVSKRALIADLVRREVDAAGVI
jgi:hypothetical protein